MSDHLQQLTSAHIVHVSTAGLTSSHNPSIACYANLVESIHFNTKQECLDQIEWWNAVDVNSAVEIGHNRLRAIHIWLSTVFRISRLGVMDTRCDGHRVHKNIHLHWDLLQPLQRPWFNCITFANCDSDRLIGRYEDGLHFMILHHTDNHADPIGHEVYTSNLIFWTTGQQSHRLQHP